MDTKTLILVGAAAALAYLIWRQRRDDVAPSQEAKLKSFASSLTGGIRLGGERYT